MKRDLDLIRDILLTLEADNFTYKTSITVASFIDPSFSKDRPEPDNEFFNSPYEQEFAKISYHIQLLLDEKFIEATYLGYDIYYKDFEIQRITSLGHDYLDSVRNPEIWEKTKAKIETLSNSVALSTITAIAQDFVHQFLGI